MNIVQLHLLLDFFGFWIRFNIFPFIFRCQNPKHVEPGRAVRHGVRGEVRDQVRHGPGAEVRDGVRQQVQHRAGAKVRDQIRGQVRDQGRTGGRCTVQSGWAGYDGRMVQVVGLVMMVEWYKWLGWL